LPPERSRRRLFDLGWITNAHFRTELGPTREAHFDQAARSERVPGGNLTAVSFLGIELTAKRLELLRELVPATARVAVLVNPADVNVARSTLRNVEAAARAMGLQVDVFKADDGREMETAFESMARHGPISYSSRPLQNRNSEPPNNDPRAVRWMKRDTKISASTPMPLRFDFEHKLSLGSV
jgi:hypothetical protein